MLGQGEGYPFEASFPSTTMTPRHTGRAPRSEPVARCPIRGCYRTPGPARPQAWRAPSTGAAFLSTETTARVVLLWEYGPPRRNVLRAPHAASTEAAFPYTKTCSHSLDPSVFLSTETPRRCHPQGSRSLAPHHQARFHEQSRTKLLVGGPPCHGLCTSETSGIRLRSWQITRSGAILYPAASWGLPTRVVPSRHGSKTPLDEDQSFTCSRKGWGYPPRVYR